jgi:hypothetical protein
LHVGHTHEDIDGCFGVLAHWFEHQIIQTPQSYKTSLEASFKETSKLKAEVVDVFVVPDYQEFFK